MLIEHLAVGELGTNCYIIACDETLEAVVIDPGGNVKKILAKAIENNLKIKYIINTHGHYDHIMGNSELKKATQAEIYIHKLDADYLIKPNLSLANYFKDDKEGTKADHLLSEGDIINIGNTIHLKVIHTPGHTPGGISLLQDKHLFAGDSLFAGSVGRTDLPGGSMRDLITGIKGKLMLLDDDVMVYPGHGPFTTIGDERKRNPFLV